MTTRSEWTALAVWVEQATGLDREADHKLAASAGLIPERMTRKGDYYSEDVSPGYRSWACPAYTASVDAILALIAETLPGWGWVLGNEGYCNLYPPDYDSQRNPSSISSAEWPETPALALCAAYCRARAASSEDQT